MTSKINLGEGQVGKLILKLAIPTVASQIVNMLYNIVDRMYIGNMPTDGVLALTGLGLCFPIIMIVSAFASLFGMGGAPRAAIAMGKGDNKQAELILGNCTMCLITSGIMMMILLLIFGESLLYMFGASDQTIKFSIDYLQVYTFGTLFVQIALGLNMFITTQGFTKFSMLTVLIGAILNIILDPIFIFAFGMGVKGAALATIISQGVSATWVIWFLRSKKSKLKIRKQNLKIQPKVILPVMALGVSPFIMTSTESILNIVFNVSLAKYGGDLAIGAMTIISSLMSMLMMPLQGITQGAQPVISYNFGAKKYDRVRSAIKVQVAICATFAIAFWFLLETFPATFISIFNRDPELMTLAIPSIRTYMFGIFAMGFQMALQMSFIALGYAKISLFLACLRKIILLIPLIFILPNFFDNKVFAVFLAEPISDIVSAMATIIAFFFMFWRKPEFKATVSNSNNIAA
ncbi:MATE family efflux transporter [Candidatus Epulonipiscium viviparus]|uniref:MATE family efflux transporter n=1 Tax=Candidatus Epulonipiscium viviparus TaxID=420336 RepID=UPI00016BFC7D|nr:MATE family efflux transporter [Candidatus Epulopiscium viviparus]